MKKLNYLKSVGLLTILVIALVFVGINFLQGQAKGKKPPKIEEKWSVEIPDGNGYYNLYGSTQNGNTFTPNEFVITRISRPSQRCPCYGFYLRVSRPDTQDPGPDTINFQGVGIDSSILNEDQGIPCVLPGLDGCLAHPDCDPPDCIAYFLNNNPHPSHGYLSTLVRIQLDADAIDSIKDEPITLSDCGYIHISLHNGDLVIPEGSTDIYHEVYGFTNVDELTITKESDGDIWIIEVNQPLEFREQYTGEYTYSRGKKEKRGTKWMTPLEVVTIPVKFRMIWTRLQ